MLPIESCLVIAFASRLCHHSGMANETPKNPGEGKFAETMRKSKEKRAGMKEQSEKRAQEAEESLQREEAKRLDQTFPNIRKSES